ncbi:hypothetical protein [Deinococcus altitudinis]|uniref:hypothetical protein n=1 Tax=Deinococcus altitudinis TaxID=468914 RepID=UPI0038914E4A
MTGRFSESQGYALREFTLPLGYLDAAGTLHRYGQMRLATALDEIEPLGDPRVKENEAFLGLLLLGRVLVRLGDFSPVPLEVVAGLYAADFAFLQAIYIDFNSGDGSGRPGGAGTPRPLGSASGGAAPQEPAPLHGTIETNCPQCGAGLILDLDPAAAASPV